MKKRRNTKLKGNGNASLDSLWSHAVKKRANGYCEICFKIADDAHHIVHRKKNWALRWDMENGVALCRECHNMADRIDMRDRIENIRNKQYLSDMQFMYKLQADFLMKLNLIEREFRVKKAEELKALLRESWELLRESC